ncbi:MAG: calcium/sodium antiporter [Patescibacteria group bacterium]
METFILIFIFTVSVVGLVKGADWFLESAEKIGLFLGLSPFIVGVTIVSLGTSFPELFTGVMAVLQETPAIVAANAIGSNVANILLVIGFSALLGGNLVVTKSLIDIDLPLLAIGTVILLGVIFPFLGGEEVIVSRPESVVLVVAYVVYFIYTIFHDPPEPEKDLQTLPSREERRDHISSKGEGVVKPNLKAQDIILLFIGIILLAFGSNYLIDSVVKISEIHQIGVGVISIIAVAIGTTLPELFVSVKAAKEGNSELALGNIFGSNLFNSFIVIGVPGIISELPLDAETYRIGIPFLIFSTLLFVISGISKKIHAYEGAFYLLLYFLFIIKIFGIF